MKAASTRMLAGVAALAAAGAASADYTGAAVVSMGDMIGDGTHTTYPIFLNFDNPDDKVLAISGNEDVSVLRWQGATLRQNSPGFETLDLQEFPFAASGPGDSWVTIDDDPANNANVGLSDAAFSPGFLNPAFPGASVINGSFFEQLDNGGWFDFDPGTVENGGSILIAQFTIANGDVPSFEATVNYTPGGVGDFVSEATGLMIVPAPGAIALLGLAGLAGTRRRRA